MAGRRSGARGLIVTLAARDLARAGDALLAAVLAPACVVCERVLETPSGGPACEACWARVVRLVPPLCPRCAHPLATHSARTSAPTEVPHAASACLVCRGWPSDLLSVVGAVGPYEGVLKELLHALKYGGRRTIASRLATLLRTSAREVLEGADGVVPIPLHRRRQWQRGFNQADLIARGLGLPVWRLLRRVRSTPPQASLAGAARRRNVDGAFRLRLVPLIRRQAAGRRLVLVDDVTTTGETLVACAAVLREAGALEVRAVVPARTVLEHASGLGRLAISPARGAR